MSKAHLINKYNWTEVNLFTNQPTKLSQGWKNSSASKQVILACWVQILAGPISLNFFLFLAQRKKSEFFAARSDLNLHLVWLLWVSSFFLIVSLLKLALFSTWDFLNYLVFRQSGICSVINCYKFDSPFVVWKIRHKTVIENFLRNCGKITAKKQ